MAFELKNIKKSLTDPERRTSLIFLTLFCGGLVFIGLHIYRSLDGLGFKCEHTKMNETITNQILEDKVYCEETMMPDLREFIDSKRDNHTWCGFLHDNVGHQKTRAKSPIYACFPAVPADMQIQVTCPMNSTVRTGQDRRLGWTVSRWCNSNGTWDISSSLLRTLYFISDTFESNY
ncbi:Oidioi.mRNA.OKI2018_I69.PAR.g8709.t1.cds [Oikopleura dioica]|uniref:Oidioi.mRNA.OKI2018_I69.PAR.g8709.t1.cds n=1 Tax=Oikopleura dioica TaxID=34765 RepID=A0ABN7RLB1_OIKDI|nr:Oidioi.mRNA.OKI2018_I69.PAR.g8709.t1.cds [Oikopleura dioica]